MADHHHHHHSHSHSHPHVEKHFTASETVKDIVIGMSDGLTVPFALAAGLSGAIDSSTIVVTAGLAEIAAGSIAMGLGGYLAAKSDSEHYYNEEKREQREIVELPDREEAEIYEIMDEYGISHEESKPIVDALKRSPDKWVEFMMRFELGLEKPDPKRSLQSALTIGLSYVVGGFIPLLPYILIDNIHTALLYSVGITLAALFGFGMVKGYFTGRKPLLAGIETMLIGGVAAAAAFFIASRFDKGK
jgi:VIT1/CCC1 family predicted Fe2+/Mn2+ transporter